MMPSDPFAPMRYATPRQRRRSLTVAVLSTVISVAAVVALGELAVLTRLQHHAVIKGDRLTDGIGREVSSQPLQFAHRWNTVAPPPNLTLLKPAPMPPVETAPPDPPPPMIPDPPAPSPAPARAQVEHRTHHHELCAAHNMRREWYTRANGWRYWRCVK